MLKFVNHFAVYDYSLTFAVVYMSTSLHCFFIITNYNKMRIKLEHAGFRYGRRQPWALSDVSLDIKPGVHLLLGENGAGKTTLLHIIDSLLFVSEGKALIDDAPISWRLPSILSKVFYCGADAPFGSTTPAAMADAHGQFYPNFSAEQLYANLSAFGLSPDSRFKSLSMGNLQKAKTAYALALNTDIVLLDEPFNGLDIESKDVLRRMIASASAENRTIIVSTHNFSDVEQLCDSYIFLSHGEVLLASEADEITGKISFVTTTERPEPSLYSELSGGRWNSIVSADDPRFQGKSSWRIDVRLLYLALHSPQRNELCNLLNSTKL